MRLSTALAFGVAAAAFPVDVWGSSPKRVILITIDGLRADAVRPDWTPNLTTLQSEGSSTLEGRCVLPPRTVPNHVSMLTGVTPQEHGFKKNLYREDVFLEDSVLTRLHSSGHSVALYLNKRKLRPLGNPAILDRLILTETGLSKANVRKFLDDLKNPETRWDFSLLHLEEPDWIGHQYGWMSPAYATAVHVADFHVGQILEAVKQLDLEKETLVIITSDHGGKKRKHKHNIPECTLIPLFTVGPGVPAGHALELPVTTQDVAPTILEAFGLPVPDAMTGRSLLSPNKEISASRAR